MLQLGVRRHRHTARQRQDDCRRVGTRRCQRPSSAICSAPSSNRRSSTTGCSPSAIATGSRRSKPAEAADCLFRRRWRRPPGRAGKPRQPASEEGLYGRTAVGCQGAKCQSAPACQSAPVPKSSVNESLVLLPCTVAPEHIWHKCTLAPLALWHPGTLAAARCSPADSWWTSGERDPASSGVTLRADARTWPVGASPPFPRHWHGLWFTGFTVAIPFPGSFARDPRSPQAAGLLSRRRRDARRRHRRQRHGVQPRQRAAAPAAAVRRSQRPRRHAALHPPAAGRRLGRLGAVVPRTTSTPRAAEPSLRAALRRSFTRNFTVTTDGRRRTPARRVGDAGSVPDAWVSSRCSAATSPDDEGGGAGPRIVGDPLARIVAAAVRRRPGDHRTLP